MRKGVLFEVLTSLTRGEFGKGDMSAGVFRAL